MNITIKCLPLVFIAGLLADAGVISEDQISGEQDNSPVNVFILDEKPSGIKEADRLGIWFPASDFEPLGLYLSPDQSIEIVVKNIKGNTQPKLLVGSYSRYKSDDVPTTYDLTAGSNTITDSPGGLLYLRFVTEDVQFISNRTMGFQTSTR